MVRGGRAVAANDGEEWPTADVLRGNGGARRKVGIERGRLGTRGDTHRRVRRLTDE